MWPITVAACHWHPRPFFAALRAPAFCKLVGSGTCSHGLCQKQESPKAGVLELLELLARSNETSGTLALEGIAWLCGALGRTDEARRAWSRAAAAGSARAQFDLGMRLYARDGSASTLYDDPNRASFSPGAPPAHPPGALPPSSPSADALLRGALKTAEEQSGLLGLEGPVICARAQLVLGMMALDGDGATQDDEAAFACFERVATTARETRQGLRMTLGDRHIARRHPAQCTPLPTVTTVPGDDPLPGEAAYAVKLMGALRTAEEDAEETMKSMDRFTFYANGRA